MGVEIRQKIGFSLFLVQKISPKTLKKTRKHSGKHNYGGNQKSEGGNQRVR